MDAGGILLGFGVMALGASGRLHGDVVVRVLGGHVGVATGAGVGLVNAGEQLSLLDKQGNLLAGGIGFGERLIRVAIQAGAVGILVGGDGGKPSQAKAQAEEASEMGSVKHIQG